MRFSESLMNSSQCESQPAARPKANRTVNMSRLKPMAW